MQMTERDLRLLLQGWRGLDDGSGESAGSGVPNLPDWLNQYRITMREPNQSGADSDPNYITGYDLSSLPVYTNEYGSSPINPETGQSLFNPRDNSDQWKGQLMSVLAVSMPMIVGLAAPALSGVSGAGAAGVESAGSMLAADTGFNLSTGAALYNGGMAPAVFDAGAAASGLGAFDTAATVAASGAGFPGENVRSGVPEWDDAATRAGVPLETPPPPLPNVTPPTSPTSPTPPKPSPQQNAESLLQRLLEGGASMDDILRLISGVTGAAQQHNFGRDLLDRADAATPNRGFYEGQLRTSYENPMSYLQGPEYQAAQDITHNKLQRSDAAGGRLANDFGRQNTLQNHAMENLNKYRTGLGTIVGQNQQTYSGQNANAAMGMGANNSWMNSILQSLLSRT